jgi:hypothetical protein
MLQLTVFVNKIRMLQRKQMLQGTRSNSIGRRSTRVRMTCRAFPLCSERQSSSLLWFGRFSYLFSAVICLCVRWMKVKLINLILHLHLYIFYFVLCFLLKWLCWMVTLLKWLCWVVTLLKWLYWMVTLLKWLCWMVTLLKWLYWMVTLLKCLYWMVTLLRCLY